MDLCEWIMSLNFEVFLYNFCKLIISISISVHIFELLCDIIIGKFIDMDIDMDKETEEFKSDMIPNIVILAILTIFMIIILIRY